MSAVFLDQAIQAERSVLGAMLLDPETVGPVLHQLTRDDFLEPRDQAVFLAIQRLRGEGRPVEPMTVSDVLGNGPYRQLLADILNSTVTAANAMEYAALCHKYALQRRVAGLGERLAECPPMDEMEAILDQLDALRCEKPGVRITSLSQCYQDFLDRHAEGKRPPYLTWGIPALDERVYVEPGDFIVLGGYPSAGKTALALQLTAHIAREKRVGYFYYENNDRKLFDRLVALKCRVPFGKIKRFDLDDRECRRIIDAQNALTAPKLEFVDASGMTAADVRATALSRHYELVVVDYLQKIPAPRERRNVSEFERVSGVSSALQDLGKQTGVTVLALSQLTRPEKGSSARPGMHSFRQSGQIEQDADVALLLYRKDEKDPKNAARILKIGKNKEGETGAPLQMHFDGETQTFSRVSLLPPPEKKKPAQASFWEDSGEDPDNPFL